MPADEYEAVQVPEFHNPLTEEIFTQFHYRNNPLAENDSFGADIYIQGVGSIAALLGSQTGFMV